MADDIPFFRGVNRMDWLFAVLLQTAADYGTDEDVRQVAAIMGDADVQRWAVPSQLYPDVLTVITSDYVFVVSASTKGAIQWIGNVLGSTASNVEPSHGSVSTYFGLCAANQYGAVRNMVLSASSSRRVVLIGFSLGGASVTIIKDMLSLADGIESACVSFGNPSAGTTSFNTGYPLDNYAGFGVLNDPLPSLPPSTWTGLGLHNAWTPFPPFVNYDHPDAGSTLLLDGTIRDGYAIQPLSEVIFGFDVGTWLTFHNQPLYARLLRTMDMPDTLPDGFQGYAHASLLDDTASRTFSYQSFPWRWATTPLITSAGGSIMACKLTMYIRDKASPPLGPREIYYFSGDDPSVPFQAAIGAVSPAVPWTTLRAAFLSKSCEIYAVGCSHVGSPKKSYLRKFSNPIQGTTGVTETIQDCVAFFGYNSNHSVKRQFHFRGIDSNWITADRLTSAAPSNLNTITTFLSVLAANGLSAYGQEAPTAQGTAIASGAKATQTSPITLTLASTGLTIPANTLVRINGCKAAPLLNADWLSVGTAPAGQVTLSGSERYSCPATLNGIINVVSQVPFALSSFEFNGVTSKKTGRPSFLQRGRASVKLRRR